MAQRLNSSPGVRLALTVSILLLCACGGDRTNTQQTAAPSSEATAATVPTSSVVPVTMTDQTSATDGTALQVGKKPAPGSTPLSTGEAGPPPQNTTAATTTAPVAVTGTHLEPPP